MPAIKRSESPGRTTPTSKPVSIKRMARIPIKPKEEIKLSGWSELINELIKMRIGLSL
jgi:hypothetical protein